MWIAVISLFIWLGIRKLFKKDVYGDNFFARLKPIRKFSEEEHAVLRAYCKEKLELNPDSLLGETYPDLKEEIVSIRKYEQIQKDYDSGKIDYLEFQLQTSKLSEKIDIKDLIN